MREQASFFDFKKANQRFFSRKEWSEKDCRKKNEDAFKKNEALENLGDSSFVRVSHFMASISSDH